MTTSAIPKLRETLEALEGGRVCMRLRSPVVPKTIRSALERYDSLPKERNRLARFLEPLALMFEWDRGVATVPLRFLANFHSRLHNLRRFLGAARHRTLFGDTQ